MASYLAPISNIYGVGPEAKHVDRLFDDAGELRDFADLSAELGEMQASLGLLELELRERLRRPHARGYPPRLFISYRRGSDEDVAFAVRLAEELEANGYDVLLDERVLGPAAEDPREVAKFIGVLADVDVALLVVTDGYLQHEGQENSMREWIFEELMRIKLLTDWGLLETVVVHRDGEIGGGIFGPLRDRHGYVDLRAAPSDPGPASACFEPWEGIRLDPEQRARLGDRAAEVVVASLQGGEANPEAALAAYAEIEDLTGTEEQVVAAAHAALAAGDKRRMRELALDGLNRNPTLPGAFLLARLLWKNECHREAFTAFAALSEAPSLWRYGMREMMAATLVLANSPRAAVNQLRWCSAAQEGATLKDPVLSELGIDVPATLDGLVADTFVVGARHCGRCAAEFPPGWNACVHCGTTCPPGEACGICAGDPPLMEDPGTLGFCPVCKRIEGENGGEASVVPREPWSFCSPLAWDPPPPQG
jgi:hypothetical protein